MLTGIESFASLGELVMGVIRFEHLTHQNPEQGFKPGSSSECLLEFDTRSKPLSHHGRLYLRVITLNCTSTLKY